MVIFTHLFRSGWSFLQEKENRRGEGVFLLSSFFIKWSGGGRKKSVCLHGFGVLTNSICPQQSHQNCEKKHFHMCKLPRRLLICAVLLWSRWRGWLPNPTNGIQIKDFIGFNCHYFFFFQIDLEQIPSPFFSSIFFNSINLHFYQSSNGKWRLMSIAHTLMQRSWRKEGGPSRKGEQLLGEIQPPCSPFHRCIMSGPRISYLFFYWRSLFGNQ